MLQFAPTIKLRTFLIGAVTPQDAPLECQGPPETRPRPAQDRPGMLPRPPWSPPQHSPGPPWNLKYRPKAPRGPSRTRLDPPKTTLGPLPLIMRILYGSVLGSAIVKSLKDPPDFENGVLKTSPLMPARSGKKNNVDNDDFVFSNKTYVQPSPSNYWMM